MWSLSSADVSLLKPSTSTKVGLYAVMCWGLICQKALAKPSCRGAANSSPGLVPAESFAAAQRVDNNERKKKRVSAEAGVARGEDGPLAAFDVFREM